MEDHSANEENTNNNENEIQNPYPEATRGRMAEPASFNTTVEKQELAKTTGPSFGLLNRFTKGSPRAYVAEYLLLLIITTSLLCLVSSMFGSIIDYIGKAPNPRFGGGFAYTSSIATLAGVAVLTPIFAIFTRRTKTVEAENVEVKNINWRRAFLGIFLLITALTAVGYGVALMYDVFSWLASFGLGTSDEAVIWKSVLKHSFSVLLFSSTALLYAKDYRSGEISHTWARLHRYALAVVTVILAIVFMVIPVQAQRGKFIDQAIVSDLRALKRKVQDFERKERKLPGSLDDLDLNEELKAHAKAYKYEFKADRRTYELCAVFKTSTKDQGGDPERGVLEQFSSGANLYDDYSDPNTSQDPSDHDKGRQCFTYDATYSGSTRNSNTRNSNLDDYYDSLSN